MSFAVWNLFKTYGVKHDRTCKYLYIVNINVTWLILTNMNEYENT